MDTLENIYLNSMRIHSKLGDPKIAASFLVEADHLVVTYTKNKERIARKYFNWLHKLSTLKNMTQEYKTYSYKALELYKNLKPQNNAIISELYSTLGRIALREKDYSKSYELFQECKRLLNETDIENVLCDTYLSAVCKGLGNFDEATKYLQKTLLFSGGGGEPLEATYQTLSFLYEEGGLLEDALGFMKKAAEEFEKQGGSKNDSAYQVLLKRISETENKLKEETNEKTK